MLMVPASPPLPVPFAPLAKMAPVVEVAIVTVPADAPLPSPLTTMLLVVAFLIVRIPPFDVVRPEMIIFLSVMV